MGVRCLLVALVHFFGPGSRPAAGGTVRTRDGRSYEGAARLEGSQVVVKAGGGGEVRIELDAVVHAVFRDGVERAPVEGEAEPRRAVSERPRALHGLRAEYFADQDLKDLRVVRVDPNIDFYWSDEGSPDPEVPDNFSACWTGQIEAQNTEQHTFYLHVNDAGRLWIDGKLVIDRWTGGPGEFQGTVDLAAGRRYDLKLEYRDISYAGSARLSWSSKHQDRQIVPSARLYPPAGTLPPEARLSSPADRSLVLVSEGVVMEAEVSDGDGEIRRVDFYANEKHLGAVTAAPWRLEWKRPAQGWHVLKVKATDDSGITTMSVPVSVAVAGDGEGALSPPWGQMPIGSRQPLGVARAAGGSFTLDCTGGDLLWGEQDAFQFVFQRLRGDGQIVARLASFHRQGQDAGSAAGILLREHLTGANARQAFLGLVPDTGLVFMRRENVWEDRRSIEDPGKAPCWLKLQRHGKVIRAHLSMDGEKWHLLGERRIEMPEEIYAGLVVADPEPNQTRAVFDEVSVSTGSPVVDTSVKGVMLRDGSILAGQLQVADEVSVRFSWRHGEVVAPRAQVARLLFRPVTAEAAERLSPGRAGAVLGSGDFFDGEVSYKDNHLHVNSVLFGLRRFNTWDEAAAGVLHDVNMGACRYEIHLADGSILRARGAEPHKGARLRVLMAGEISVTFPAEEIMEIRAGS